MCHNVIVRCFLHLAPTQDFEHHAWLEDLLNELKGKLEAGAEIAF
jgi:hypothetical protein